MKCELGQELRILQGAPHKMEIVLHNRAELNRLRRKLLTSQEIREMTSSTALHLGALQRPELIKVNIPDLTAKEIVQLVLECENIAEVWIKTSAVSAVSKGGWLRFKKSQSSRTYLLKRVMDIIIGVMLLIGMLPVFAIASILVRISSKGSIIFLQPRVNNDLKIFNLYKFRTMNHFNENIHQEFMRRNIKNPNPNQKVHKLIDDPRITGIGKWIRRLSIDELPQLMNILKGEMSLVGPRPPIPYEVKEYADWHYARLRAKPGLTGLWQVRGRSLIPFEEMVLLDLYYAYNQSVWLDIKILLQTIPMVLSLKGAF